MSKGSVIIEKGYYKADENTEIVFTQDVQKECDEAFASQTRGYKNKPFICKEKTNEDTFFCCAIDAEPAGEFLAQKVLENRFLYLDENKEKIVEPFSGFNLKLSLNTSTAKVEPGRAYLNETEGYYVLNVNKEVDGNFDLCDWDYLKKEKIKVKCFTATDNIVIDEHEIAKNFSNEGICSIFQEFSPAEYLIKVKIKTRDDVTTKQTVIRTNTTNTTSYIHAFLENGKMATVVCYENGDVIKSSTDKPELQLLPNSEYIVCLCISKSSITGYLSDSSSEIICLSSQSYSENTRSDEEGFSRILKDVCIGNDKNGIGSNIEIDLTDTYIAEIFNGTSFTEEIQPSVKNYIWKPYKVIDTYIAYPYLIKVDNEIKILLAADRNLNKNDLNLKNDCFEIPQKVYLQADKRSITYIEGDNHVQYCDFWNDNPSFCIYEKVNTMSLIKVVPNIEGARVIFHILEDTFNHISHNIEKIVETHEKLLPVGKRVKITVSHPGYSTAEFLMTVDEDSTEYVELQEEQPFKLTVNIEEDDLSWQLSFFENINEGGYTELKNNSLEIDWGDNSSTTLNSVIDLVSLTHSYAQAGIYQVTVSSTNNIMPGLNYSLENNFGKKIQSIDTPFLATIKENGDLILDGLTEITYLNKNVFYNQNKDWFIQKKLTLPKNLTLIDKNLLKYSFSLTNLSFETKTEYVHIDLFKYMPIAYKDTLYFANSSEILISPLAAMYGLYRFDTVGLSWFEKPIYSFKNWKTFANTLDYKLAEAIYNKTRRLNSAFENINLLNIDLDTFKRCTFAKDGTIENLFGGAAIPSLEYPENLFSNVDKNNNWKELFNPSKVNKNIFGKDFENRFSLGINYYFNKLFGTFSEYAGEKIEAPELWRFSFEPRKELFGWKDVQAEEIYYTLEKRPHEMDILYNVSDDMAIAVGYMLSTTEAILVDENKKLTLEPTLGINVFNRVNSYDCFKINNNEQEVFSNWKDIPESWGGPRSEENFSFKIQTTPENLVFTIPFILGSYLDLKTQPLLIHWGDGDITSIEDGDISAEKCTHQYEVEGEYTISITSIEDTHMGYKPAYIIPEFKTYQKQKVLPSALLITEIVTPFAQMINTDGEYITNFENTLRGAENIVTICDTILNNLWRATSLANFFRKCTKLTNLPSSLFSNLEGDVKLNACFQDCTTIEELPSTLLQPLRDITTLHNTFNGCTGLTIIPETLLSNNVNLVSLDRCFANLKIKTIPANLFAQNTKITTLEGIFESCEELIQIPSDLFENLTELVSVSNCFRCCKAIKSIPQTLFVQNTKLQDCSYTFAECSELASIPSSIFINNEDIRTFEGCFFGPCAFETIPEDLFNANSLVSTFKVCFSSNSNLKTLPDRLFYYHTLCESFEGTFAQCNRVKINPLIFGSEEDKTERFVTPVGKVSFKNMFLRHTNKDSAKNGTAPDLWDWTFTNTEGTPYTPDMDNCYGGNGNNIETLINYLAIPEEWR